MCKTQRAISEWCLDPMDCLCMFNHFLLTLSITFIHSPRLLCYSFLGFFGLVFLLCLSLSFWSPAVFPIAPPIYFSLALSVSAFSPLSHSIDGYYSFSAPIYSSWSCSLCLSFLPCFLSSRYFFQSLSVFLDTARQLRSVPPPPVAMPAREARDKARECKSTSPTNDKRVYGNCPEDQPVIKPPPGFPRLH